MKSYKYKLNESLFEQAIDREETPSIQLSKPQVPLVTSDDPEFIDFFMKKLVSRALTGGYYDVTTLLLVKAYQYYFGVDGNQDPASVPLLSKVYLNMLVGEARPDRKTGGGDKLGMTNASKFTNFALLKLFDNSVTSYIKPGPLLKDFCEGKIEVEGEVNEGGGRKQIKVYVDNPKLKPPKQIKHDFRDDLLPGGLAYGWVDPDGTNAKGCAIRRTCTSATDDRADKEFFEQFGDWIQTSGRHYKLFPGEEPQKSPEDDPYVSSLDVEDDILPSALQDDDEMLPDANYDDIEIDVTDAGGSVEPINTLSDEEPPIPEKTTPTDSNSQRIYMDIDSKDDEELPSTDYSDDEKNEALDESIVESIIPDYIKCFTDTYRNALSLDKDCNLADYYNPYQVDLICCIHGLTPSTIKREIFGKV